jgi:phage terminase small subunit
MEMTKPTALTPKQENFCLAYLETGNASEAYRRAYDVGGMTDTSINRKAKELLDNGKIAARIEQLRAPIREKAMLTLESHLARLEELSRKAEEAAQFGPAITAETNRGKAAGLYTDKVDVTSNGGSIAPTRIIIEAAEK